MKLSFTLFLTLAVIFSCTSQSSLSNADILKEDLSGKLPENKLKAIAKVIRELEANPYERGEKKANTVLFKWITVSPDVNVTVYPIISKATQLNGSTSGKLTIQLILSTAGAIIENPELQDDDVKATTEGLSRTLAVYKIIRNKEGIKDHYLDELLEKDDQGKLEDAVEKIILEAKENNESSRPGKLI